MCSSRRARPNLAASFVFTVALAPACGGSPPVIMNPPPPDATDGTGTGAPESGGSGSGSESGEQGGGAQGGGDGTSPPPDPDRHVQRRPDGTCWEYFDVRCPPDATCNPPPPRRVDCPANLTGNAVE
jgi:hypothetical protein